MRETDALLQKAGRSFAAARLLSDAGETDFAASRAYYGYFYVAEALLLSEDLRLSRHGQVIAQYGRLFGKTGVLDRRFHRLFRRAFQLRQSADYVAAPVLPSVEVVLGLIQEGEAFLDAARGYLQNRQRREERDA